jgi:hypothetical protein
MTTVSLLDGLRKKAPGYYNAGGVQTITHDVTNFTGIIVFYASLEQDPDPLVGTDWAEVGRRQFANETGQAGIVLTGNYTWLRADINNDSGTLTALDLTY